MARSLRQRMQIKRDRDTASDGLDTSNVVATTTDDSEDSEEEVDIIEEEHFLFALSKTQKTGSCLK